MKSGTSCVCVCVCVCVRLCACLNQRKLRKPRELARRWLEASESLRILLQTPSPTRKTKHLTRTKARHRKKGPTTPDFSGQIFASDQTLGRRAAMAMPRALAESRSLPSGMSWRAGWRWAKGVDPEPWLGVEARGDRKPFWGTSLRNTQTEQAESTSSPRVGP